MALIRVSAVVLHNETGQILTVRKRGTGKFMLPGGKPEAGESPAQTAVREVAEEVGAHLAPGDLTYLGTFRAAAANEAGFDVEGQAFSHPAPPQITIGAEIAQARWLEPDPNTWPPELAPLLATKILPAFLARQHK